MSLFNGLRPFGVKKIPSLPSRLSGYARTCRAACPFWTLGDPRISMSESIRRNRGLAKDLFAATACRSRNVQLRQWLGGGSDENRGLLRVDGCGAAFFEAARRRSLPPDPHGHSRPLKPYLLKKQPAGCVFMSRRNRPAATGKWNSSG